MSWFYWVLVALLSWAAIAKLVLLSKDEIKPLTRRDMVLDFATIIFLLIGCLLWL